MQDFVSASNKHHVRSGVSGGRIDELKSAICYFCPSENVLELHAVLITADDEIIRINSK